MCGRYELNETPARLKARFDLSGDLFVPSDPLEFRPTNRAPIIRFADGVRRLSTARWGLIPSWWKQEKMPESTFNARGETVNEKPMFRHAFRKQRCIVPASGFYEWRVVPGQSKKQKLRISLADAEPVALAGLWEWHEGFGEGPVESFTIITCEPNEAMAEVHNRMPVILSPDDFGLWLAPEQPPEALEQLLRPCPSDDLIIQPAG